MKFEIKVPSIGESVNSANIEVWEKQSGDLVQKGDTLVTLETDKASMDIPSEYSGKLTILKQKGETVSVGEIIGFIESQTSSISENHPIEKATDMPINSKKQIQDLKNTKIDSMDKNKLSPSVLRLVETHSIKTSDIQGTGRSGRLTKGDILKALNETTQAPTALVKEVSQDLTEQNTVIQKAGQKRELMTNLRRRTAEKLVHSQQNTATLSTFNEVNLSRIIEIRKNYQEEFVKKHGIKLGFMSFFVKAVVSALKEYPKINAFIEESHMVYNEYQHIGIAVSTKKGLVVPVLFHAEKLSLAEIEKKIIEYRDKALDRKLSPDDLLGGTFTISNGGVFGSLLSTPILNPPQSGILGMHKIQERPIVINGKLEIKPMMYLTLSYDHRIVDGRESVGFLVKVKEALEEPARLIIDI